MVDLHVLRALVKDDVSIMGTIGRLDKGNVSSRVFCQKIIIFRLPERGSGLVIADDGQHCIRFCVRQMIQRLHANVIIHNNDAALFHISPLYHYFLL